MMRREFVQLAAGAAMSWPLGARAQQKAMPVIGYIAGGSPERDTIFLPNIRQGLNATGYVEGQNLAIETRSAEGDLDRMPALVAELVDRDVDLILMIDGLPGAVAAKNATSRIPIVFLVGVDPVKFGLVDNLARPGGNLTGVTVFGGELSAKRLELLTELVPQAKVIAWLVNPRNSSFPSALADIPESLQIARARSVRLALVAAGAENELEPAFASLAQREVAALLLGADPFFYTRRDQLVRLAARYGVPAIYVSREFTKVGGLFSYGVDVLPLCRQVGIYAGRILKGEKPADLPVQQPTKFQLVINLKTATALGLAVPQVLLARADEVIE